jgi:Xaa-Pro aminopeptidase
VVIFELTNARNYEQSPHLRTFIELKPGHVLTIEPGIFIPQLIDLWQKQKINTEFLNFEKINQYWNFTGLHNEVDVLITEIGHRVLGEPLPKTVKDVEALREVAFQ